MSRSATTAVVWLAVTAGTATLGWAVSNTSIGSWVEQRSYDLRFAWRGSLPISIAAPVTILAIDEKSLATLPEPLMLWHSHFAAVLDGLTMAEAAAVGIDFLFANVSGFDPEGQQQLGAALLDAGSGGLPVALAYRVGRLGVEQPPEAVRLAALAVGHRLGYANLTTDSDDFVRTQEIAAPAEDGTLEPSFPLAVAGAFAASTGRPLAVDPAATRTVRINFRGPGHFPVVSFGDAVEAARRDDAGFFASNFAGRIVLIGRVGERGDEDFHSTPQYYWTDRSNREIAWRTPGVEVHANTITTLIEGDPIREASGALQAAATLLVAAGVTLVCLLLPPAWGVALGLATIASLAVLAFEVLFPANYWLPLVSPGTAGALALGTAELANYVREGREKRYLRGAFRRYVDDTVIERIVRSPDALSLRGESRPISVLFADIRNFTSRSESTPPEILVGQLNRYFEGMVRAIQGNGGMLDKFIGDGIMAVFGAPLDDPDAPLNAVRAAAAMLSELEGVNASLAAGGQEPIRIGIGIDTGTAVVGNIGSPERMEYTAIGDVVNTAARIESLTRQFDADVLLSAATYDAVRDHVAAESLGSAQVKGKAGPVQIFRLTPDRGSRASDASIR